MAGPSRVRSAAAAAQGRLLGESRAPPVPRGAAGPSERRAHTARPPPRGSSGGQGRRQGRRCGPLPARPLASPQELLPGAAAAASVALAKSRGARLGLGPPLRLGARRRLSAAGGAAQCPARRPQPASVASCPVRPEGGGAPAPSRGSATGSAPAPRLQPRALRSRRTPRPAPRGREAELRAGPRPPGGGVSTKGRGHCVLCHCGRGQALRGAGRGGGWNDARVG